MPRPLWERPAGNVFLSMNFRYSLVNFKGNVEAPRRHFTDAANTKTGRMLHQIGERFRDRQRNIIQLFRTERQRLRFGHDQMTHFTH